MQLFGVQRSGGVLTVDIQDAYKKLAVIPSQRFALATSVSAAVDDNRQTIFFAHNIRRHGQLRDEHRLERAGRR